MNRMLNDRFGKKASSGKRGCLFLIAGSLLALLATGLYVLAVSALTGVLIEALHGGEIAYALMDIVTPSYVVAMLLFYGVLAIWYFTPTEAEIKKQNRSLSPMLGQKESTALSKRTLWLITTGLLAGVVVTGAVSVNTYRLVTPNGVRSYFFVETASYEWKQVSSYTIDCENEDDGLSVTFTMRDGKKYEILQGVNSATKAFKEEYTSVTHFAADVDETMMELQIPRNVKHIERAVKVYRGHKLWPYVEKLIGYVELNPLPDETVPETEAPTEAVTESVSESN